MFNAPSFFQLRPPQHQATADTEIPMVSKAGHPGSQAICVTQPHQQVGLVSTLCPQTAYYTCCQYCLQISGALFSHFYSLSPQSRPCSCLTVTTLDLSLLADEFG